MASHSAAIEAYWGTFSASSGMTDTDDDAFAWDEGEGDHARAVRLAHHLGCFAEQAAGEGWEMRCDLERHIGCFTVVWPPQVADPPQSGRTG